MREFFFSMPKANGSSTTYSVSYKVSEWYMKTWEREKRSLVVSLFEKTLKKSLCNCSPYKIQIWGSWNLEAWGTILLTNLTWKSHPNWLYDCRVHYKSQTPLGGVNTTSASLSWLLGLHDDLVCLLLLLLLLLQAWVSLSHL